MIIVVENRQDVGAAYVDALQREGMASAAIAADEALDWFGSLSANDRAAVRGVLLGCGAHTADAIKAARMRCKRPVIALADRRLLIETLHLFSLGVDDVVPKPVHVRELLARIRVIAERGDASSVSVSTGDIIFFIDGRDPLVGGAALVLPRRERRILECLFNARGAWLTKPQIFNQVYGLFNEHVDESVIESHISRLRKRLRERLGYDAIKSQRYLGYRIEPAFRSPPFASELARPEQAPHDEVESATISD